VIPAGMVTPAGTLGNEVSDLLSQMDGSSTVTLAQPTAIMEAAKAINSLRMLKSF
jgi:hypothetical protein